MHGFSLLATSFVDVASRKELELLLCARSPTEGGLRFLEVPRFDIALDEDYLAARRR